MNAITIGTRIKIIEMKDIPLYNGRNGVVESIDDIGQLHGTWGGCAIVPSIDEIEIINYENHYKSF